MPTEPTLWRSLPAAAPRSTANPYSLDVLLAVEHPGGVPTTRTNAAVRVFYEHGSAAHVTRTLGIRPSMSHEADEPRSATNTRPWGAAMWSLDSPLPDTEPLNAHLAALCAELGDKSQNLAALRAEGYDLDCFCFVEVLNGQGGVSITPELLMALGSLSIELDLDIYASNDDE